MPTSTELQPALILHTQPYRDTSLLVYWLTSRHGKIHSVARNARGLRSRFKGLLQPFIPFLITWSGKTELVNLQHAEIASMPYILQGTALLSGIYLNELLMRLLLTADSHPRLYEAYYHTLAALQKNENLRSALRLFEKQLLIELGYGLSLDKEAVNGEVIQAQNWYRCDPQRGLMRCEAAQDDKVFQGKNLLALHNGVLQDHDDLQAAKRLMRLLLAPLLGDRPLRSRELFVKSTPSPPAPLPSQKALRERGKLF
jgi:DNA repair protein RecO (recombination protein O)